MIECVECGKPVPLVECAWNVEGCPPLRKVQTEQEATRLEIGKARVEISEVKAIVTNGLTAKVNNIDQNMATKADIDAVKEIAQAWEAGRTIWRLIHDVATAVVKVAAVFGVVGGVAGGLGRLWGVL